MSASTTLGKVVQQSFLPAKSLCTCVASNVLSLPARLWDSFRPCNSWIWSGAVGDKRVLGTLGMSRSLAAVQIRQNLPKPSPSAECSVNRPIRPNGSLWRRAGLSVSGRWWAGVTVEMGAVVQCLDAQFISFDQLRTVTFHMRDWSWGRLDLSADRCFLSARSVFRRLAFVVEIRSVSRAVGGVSKVPQPAASGVHRRPGNNMQCVYSRLSVDR